MRYYERFRPYVSVAERRRQAQVELAKLRKKGLEIQPIAVSGRKIAKTFWGSAWCDHLEAFSDFENRLPRGRTYVRNGSVCHLNIDRGVAEARVIGSELYSVEVQIRPLPTHKWTVIKQRCAGKIGSLVELLQGKLSSEVMRVVTDLHDGLFPLPEEIELSCDCPDWAGMCKHIAAVMYGIGARLDQQPQLLFLLRDVDHEDLIAVDADAAIQQATAAGDTKTLAAADLSDVFGIDLDAGDSAEVPLLAPASRKKKATRKKTDKSVAASARKPAVKKKNAKKKATKKKATEATSAQRKTKKKTAKKAVTKNTTGKKTTAKKKAAKRATAKKKATRKPSQEKPARKPTKKQTAKKRDTKKATTKKKAASKKAAPQAPRKPR